MSKEIRGTDLEHPGKEADFRDASNVLRIDSFLDLRFSGKAGKEDQIIFFHFLIAFGFPKIERKLEWPTQIFHKIFIFCYNVGNWKRHR